MDLALDHVVIAVHDAQAPLARYEALLGRKLDGPAITLGATRA